ncbi:MAG: hypothetical protein M1821_000707 [Bathelium mastoideum]|nr:MAG: hypothetical protein M1821_000707 [Bathelium mastoideum]
MAGRLHGCQLRRKIRRTGAEDEDQAKTNALKVQEDPGRICDMRRELAALVDAHPETERMAELSGALEDARRLAEPLANANQDESQLPVGAVAQAQRVLVTLHRLLEEERRQKISAGQTIDVYDGFRVKTVTILLELVAVHGLLPQLPPEVGEIKKMKYVFTSSSNAEQSNILSPSTSLGDLASPLIGIATETGKGIEPMIRDSILPIIACAAATSNALVVPPASESHPQNKIFHDFAERLPMVILLPVLTSLTRSIKTPELHDLFATEISLLPIRPHGVQHVIEFIASSLVPASAVKADVQNLENQVQEIPMSLEALQQASKLLSSAPKALDAETYFENIAKQLLALMDGTCGPTMTTAAAYIIGTGILGKRSTGAPGTIGWNLFATPLIETINPGPNGSANRNLRGEISDRVSVGRIIVSGTDLDLALRRLSKIVLSHPNPGVTKRLTHSLLLPLWGLACLHDEDSPTSSPAWKLLETYIRLYANPEQIREIARNVLFDGPAHWVFVTRDDGLIETQRRAESEQLEAILLDKMTGIDRRASLFVKLLSVCSVQGNVACSIFEDSLQHWRFSRSPLQSESNDPSRYSTDELLRPVAGLKLATELISNFQHELASQPETIVRITHQLLADIVKSSSFRPRQKNMALTDPILNQLGQISQSASALDNSDDSRELSEESVSIAAMAISLVNISLQTPNVSLTSVSKTHLQSIQRSVDILKQHGRDVPTTLITAASNLSLRIDAFLQSRPETTESSLENNTTWQNFQSDTSEQAEKNHKTYTEALEDCSSPQPPIRVEAFSRLSGLVSARSSAVDVPVVTALLLNILNEDSPAKANARTASTRGQKDPEEADDYVVLGALRLLTQLAEFESRLVRTLLVDAYLDTQTSSGFSLDARLRIAECLGSIVDAFRNNTHLPPSTKAFRDDFIIHIITAATTIASRRGRRLPPATVPFSSPALTNPSSVAPSSEAEPVHPFPNDDDDASNHHAILDAWRLSHPLEEDLRLRASALSLLAHTFSRCPLSLFQMKADNGGGNSSGGGGTLLAAPIEIACAVLQRERGAAHAIVRRAAVVMALEFVRAVERAFGADEEGGGAETAVLWVEWGVDGMVERVGVVVREAVEEDEDELVRGHAMAVVEELEAWRVRRMVGIAEAGGPEGAGMTGELELKRLKGLRVGVGGGEDRDGGRKLVEEVDD